MSNSVIQQLFGIWETDPTDAAALAEYGSVRMEFKEDGQLIYAIKKKGKEQIIMMTYGVDDNKLITDQPSHPQREVTKFSIAGNMLMLDYRNRQSIYIRGKTVK